MNKILKAFQTWVTAFRPRTLLLVIAGSLSAYTAAKGHDPSLSIAFLVLITSLALQILSNLANDYGDTLHGADNTRRVGPVRAVQTGAIKPSEMRLAIVVAAIVAMLSGALLLFQAYQIVGLIPLVLFAILGGLAIWAAIAYTATRDPYGYKGLGDVMVFLFFGIVIVCGGSFLISGKFISDSLLLGTGIGLLSTGVLNINNLRDLDNDKRVNKITVAVKLGPSLGRAYHTALIIGAITSVLLFSIPRAALPSDWLWLVTVPLFVIHLYAIWAYPVEKYNRLLSQLVLLTLILAIGLSLL